MNTTNSSSQLNSCGFQVPVIPNARHTVRYLDLCTYPFFLLFCTMGNLVSLIVLKREKPFGSKNIYLMAIAVADLLYMWNALLSYLSNYDGEIYGRPRDGLISFLDPTYGTAIFLQEMSAVASAWLIVGFTLERFLAIKYPLKHFSQGKRSAVVVGLIFAVASITGLCRLIDYYWFYTNYLRFPERRNLKANRPPILLNLNSANIWLFIVVQLSSFMTILILNLFLVRIIIRSNRSRQKTLLAHTQENSRIDWGALAMLGGCVVLYIVTQSPAFVTNILYILDRLCIKEWDRSSRNIQAPIYNTLQNLNFTLNFFIYCGVNRKFRESAKSVLRCKPIVSQNRRKSLDSALTLVTKRSSIPHPNNLN